MLRLLVSLALAAVVALLAFAPGDSAAFDICKPLPGGGEYCVTLPDPPAPTPPPSPVDQCAIKPEACLTPPPPLPSFPPPVCAKTPEGIVCLTVR